MILSGSFKLNEIKSLFRKRPERLGVDISENYVRVVRTRKVGDSQRQLAAFDELVINPWRANSIELQKLKSFIRQVGAGQQKISLNIEHPSLRIRRMTLAKMPERDMLEAIRWNFREQIEVPIEKYMVGFTPLNTVFEGNKYAIIAYGVAYDAILQHLQLAKSLGLKVVSLEPSATALLAAFYHNGFLEDGRHHVCIASSDSASYFLVMKDSMLLFSRPIMGISQTGLVKYLVRNLNMEENSARDALLEWVKGGASDAATQPDGGGETSLVKRVDSSVKIFFSKLVIEIQRSIDAFCIMYGVDGVQIVHLCGDAVFLPGLVNHLKKTLGIETDVFNPFKNLASEDVQTEAAKERAPLYAIATGLAIP